MKVLAENHVADRDEQREDHHPGIHPIERVLDSPGSAINFAHAGQSTPAIKRHPAGSRGFRVRDNRHRLHRLFSLYGHSFVVGVAVIAVVVLTILSASDLGIPTEVSGPIMILAVWSVRNSRRRESERSNW